MASSSTTTNAWGKGSLKSCDALLQRVENNQIESLVILPNKTFGSQEVERLAGILQSKNNQLTSISASGHCIPPNALQTLGDAIFYNSHSRIRHLSIGDETMGDDGIQALLLGSSNRSEAASCTWKLDHLDFGFKGITPIGMGILGQVLGPSDIQTLELYRNGKIGNDGMATFCQGATGSNKTMGDIPFRSLQVLDISECNIGAKGMEELANCLIHQHQDPNDNDDSRRRRQPIDLMASINPLTSQSSAALGRLISTNTLSRLSVKNCDLQDDVQSALGLASILPSTQWTELNLSKNEGIGSEGVIAIAKALGGVGTNTPTLRTLDLGATNCGTEGAIAMLQECASLKSLRLFDNQLGSSGLEGLAPCLQGGHETLEHLDLGGNRANEAAVVSVLQAIITDVDKDNKNSVLHTLELGGNQGGDEVERIIRQELELIRPNLDVARDKPTSRQQQQQQMATPLLQQERGLLFDNPQTSWSRPCHILLQNENGPCPLLAAANVLLLKGSISLPSNTISAGVVTIDQLVNVLAEKILTNTSASDHHIQEVMQVFPTLQFGMDVNPKFTAGPTGVEYTLGLNAFDLLNIELVHGWLIDPQSPEYTLIGDRTYNQLINAVIEGNDASAALQTGDVERIKRDELSTKANEGSIIHEFLESSGHQLTQYGLTVLYEYMKDGQMAVFFRNNHFNTLTKHEGHLYLLVTDIGYASVGNIVWEKLDMINGDTEYVGQEFLPPPPMQQHQVADTATGEQLVANDMQSQADYQLALQLSQETTPQPSPQAAAAAAAAPVAAVPAVATAAVAKKPPAKDPEMEAAKQASFLVEHPSTTTAADSSESNNVPTVAAAGVPLSAEDRDRMVAMQLQEQEEREQQELRRNDDLASQTLAMQLHQEEQEQLQQQRQQQQLQQQQQRPPQQPVATAQGSSRNRATKDGCVIS
eukprot:scaffold2212_cov143-Cylindrotheca_fusiformis.AAC.7